MTRTSEIPNTLGELLRVHATPPPDKFDDLTAFEVGKLIEKWFFLNFDSPRHHDSAVRVGEVKSDPIETRDILEAVFENILSDEMIEYVLRFIQTEGELWSFTAKEPHLDDGLPGIVGVEELHAEMLRRIGELEKVVAKIKVSPAGIGHNYPPERRPVEC